MMSNLKSGLRKNQQADNILRCTINYNQAAYLS